MDSIKRREESQAVARRSLQDSRQILGIWPTWWFWNDWEQQRLLMPLMLLVGVPLGLVFFGIQALGAPLWLWVGSCVASPVVFLGLVERHIRASLGRRDPVEPQIRTEAPRPTSVRVAALLGVLVSGAALAGVGGAPPGVLLALSLLAAACLAWLLTPAIAARLRSLRAGSARSLPPGDDA